MATMTSGFLTTLLPRPSGLGGEGLVWSVWSGSFTTEGGAVHNGERTWTPSPSYRTFDAASTYCMAGMEAKNMIGVGGVDNYIFEVETATGQPVASVRVNAAGFIKVFNGTTLIATSALSYVTSGATYYTLEFAWANTATNVSYEVRIGGSRIAELTSSDIGSASDLPIGTGPRPAPGGAGGAGAVCSRVMVADINTGQAPVIYWYWQKNGASLWTSKATGSTFALSSDFTGAKKRAWLYPNAVGNYTMPGAGSGTQTSNWANGAGTYPASIADNAAGFDADSTYIRNQVNGTGVAADKISHGYTDLPVAATTIGFVQRTAIARLDAATSGSIRTGRRVSGSDTADSTATLGSGYSVGVPTLLLSKYYPAQPDGTTIYTPALVNAFEGIVELVTVS